MDVGCEMVWEGLNEGYGGRSKRDVQTLCCANFMLEKIQSVTGYG